MILFRKENNKVVLSYTSNMPSPEWVYESLEKSGVALIGQVFTVKKSELISTFDENDVDKPVEFEVAILTGDYYCFSRKVLSLKNDLYIHKNVKLDRKVFVAERNISIFPKVDGLVKKSIYIGGDHEDAIPEAIFQKLLKTFPNTYELNRYASARISSVISSYIETKSDYEEKYQHYLNKKPSIVGTNPQITFSEVECFKYQSLLDKLKQMLIDEEKYSEAQWQEELLQIILLIYPKYISVFKEAPVRDTYSNSNRSIDFLLVDSSGNTDIIEIKKPFNKCIVTDRTYRDNFIPLRELSGTVMQIEKYIFYLNKWGKKGEEHLTEYYKNKLPDGFEIKITNPCGIIIMGRTKGLSAEQIQDFEVIKRKYKNVIDIITYDDLLNRLEFIIRHWTNTYNQSNQSSSLI